MGNGAELVGAAFQIPDLRSRNVELRAIAIAPRFTRDDRDIVRRLDLAHALQRFAQDRSLGFELQLIAGVLIVAAAAAAEVRASWLHSPFRGREHLANLAAQQSAALRLRFDQHALAGQHVGNEHDPSVDAAEPVSSVHQLLDCQFKVCLWRRHRVG